jgi:hypothetical protein
MRQAGRSIVVAVFLAMAGAAVAGQLEDGQAAIKRHDYANAMRLLEPLAEQGNADEASSRGAGRSPRQMKRDRRQRTGICGALPFRRSAAPERTIASTWPCIAANLKNFSALALSK